MLIQSRGIWPKVDPSSYIAPNACLCGDVTIGKNCRIMHGASVIAEGGKIVLGENIVVLENAVLRSTPKFDLRIAGRVLIGPHCHVVGCEIEERVFVATGASVFHGAILRMGSEVRINGVVHIRTVLGEGETVPIGWVAVGSPAQIFPPHEHGKIWEIQRELDFPMTVYGVDRNNSEDVMAEISEYMTGNLSFHSGDRTEPDSERDNSL